MHYVVQVLVTFQAELSNIIGPCLFHDSVFYVSKSEAKFPCVIPVKQTVIASSYLVHWYVIPRVETCSIL